MGGRTPGWRGRRIVWRAVAMLPFCGATRRRIAYALVAAPAGVCGLLLALAGGAPLAARMHAALARRLLEQPATAAQGPGGTMRIIGHALVMAVPNAFVLAATCYLWAVVVLNFAYPVRLIEVPAAELLHNAWGGPTLLGAWAVHALGAVPMLWVAAFAATALTTLQGRSLRLTGVCPAPPSPRPLPRGRRSRVEAPGRRRSVAGSLHGKEEGGGHSAP